MVRAGDHRVQTGIERCVEGTGSTLELVPDRHFLCTLEDFESWAEGRKQLRLEHFYRHLRQRTGVLMDGDAPLGGRWNFDADNRASFGREGPASLHPPKSFRPDPVTRDVLDLVERRFARHPGSLDAFDWPVTRRQALLALNDFTAHRLPLFGRYQDAMWDSEPWLYHSRLSAALNLKLLAPGEVVAAAEQALTDGHAPVSAVEGFIRQVLGWREFVRGLYWRDMPAYAGRNELGAELPLPTFYWTAETDMACLHAVIAQTLRHGYAHHIQRLMVTGLFALLLGVEPKQVHEWYLAVYVDAVEWVELPNTIGMSQYADGGVMASKPYVASGRYINRMSNYCSQCRYDPAQSTGDRACPFTTLYWDFLMRHRNRFAGHPRAGYQWRNLTRLNAQQRREIQRQARRLREHLVRSATTT
jgi:deoxyribodipyrimidine photolyase-related protein